MVDLIRRQAAIDALDEIHHALWEIDIPSPTVPEYIEHHESVKKVMKVVLEKREELKNLPSRKKGKWIEIKNSKGAVIALRCDQCLMSPKNGVRSDFCPNCGSDNRE